jgi:hypothetical protein
MAQAKNDHTTPETVIPRPEKSHKDFYEFYDKTGMAINEIKHMVEVAYRASESLKGADGDRGMWQLPTDEAQLLDFAINDIQKRVGALQKEFESF